MKLRAMAMVGALAGMALVGCSSGSNAPTATGEATTAQTGTIVGQITDVDSQSFNVKPPNGNEITLHRSAQAGNVNLQKGAEVRASFRVDTDGNKIAQNVQVLSMGTQNQNQNQNQNSGNSGNNP